MTETTLASSVWKSPLGCRAGTHPSTWWFWLVDCWLAGWLARRAPERTSPNGSTLLSRVLSVQIGNHTRRTVAALRDVSSFLSVNAQKTFTMSLIFNPDSTMAFPRRKLISDGNRQMLLNGRSPDRRNISAEMIEYVKIKKGGACTMVTQLPSAFWTSLAWFNFVRTWNLKEIVPICIRRALKAYDSDVLNPFCGNMWRSSSTRECSRWWCTPECAPELAAAQLNGSASHEESGTLRPTRLKAKFLLLWCVSTMNAICDSRAYTLTQREQLWIFSAQRYTEIRNIRQEKSNPGWWLSKRSTYFEGC